MFDDSFKSRYVGIPYALYVLERAEASYTLPPHNHKEIEFIAMTDGEVDFYIGTTPFHLCAGDVLIIPPYCVHQAKISPTSSYCCICFDLSIIQDDRLRSSLEDGSLTACRALTAEDSHTKEIHEHVKKTISAFTEKRSGWELEIVGRLSLVFATLKECDFFVHSIAEAKDDKFCKNVVELVAQRYGENVTSTILAKELYMNNAYFCRLFKKHFHCNFSDFINEYRIEKAKFLLEHSTLSISGVAEQCGFNSFSYFCKIFKHILGLSPSSYRKKAKK